MNTSDPMPTLEIASDAELVAATLAGDRRAFGKIVERYQRLLCSLAYSATGQLSQSEDLAQDAFVDAWRQLSTLREPDKLRSWLCGILRFKVSRLRRADGREPVRQAEALDETAEEIASGDETAPDLAVQKEEQAIMWSALERVPETYREPLILYYREGRSVEHVASALDLTEDNVKQRLARGRKILQEQVLAFVEGALARSTPGRVFTLTVLAALPEIATPVKAVGVGMAAAHGTALAKSTGFAVFAAWVSGIVGPILTLRANLDQARTPRERRLTVLVTCGFVFGAFGFLGVLWLLRQAAYGWWEQRAVFAAIVQVLVVAFVVAWPVALLRVLRRMREIRSEERAAHPEHFHPTRDRVGSPESEYKSAWRPLGVPLVHIRFSAPGGEEGPVFGWFAGGDRAYGLIFAWGGVAVAPISVGSVAAGLLAAGNLSFGVVSAGTVGVGVLTVGCAAIGVKAFAWLSALGWDTAAGGGFSIAQTAALGPVGFAQYVNDAAARQYFPPAAEHHMILVGVLAFLSVVPIACYSAAIRKRLGRRKGS